MTVVVRAARMMKWLGVGMQVARDQGQVAAEKVSESWKKISSKAMENERVGSYLTPLQPASRHLLSSCTDHQVDRPMWSTKDTSVQLHCSTVNQLA